MSRFLIHVFNMRQFCNGDIGREYFNIGIKVRTALKVGGAGGGGNNKEGAYWKERTKWNHYGMRYANLQRTNKKTITKDAIQENCLEQCLLENMTIKQQLNVRGLKGGIENTGQVTSSGGGQSWGTTIWKSNIKSVQIVDLFTATCCRVILMLSETCLTIINQKQCYRYKRSHDLLTMEDVIHATIRDALTRVFHNERWRNLFIWWLTGKIVSFPSVNSRTACDLDTRLSETYWWKSSRYTKHKVIEKIPHVYIKQL